MRDNWKIQFKSRLFGGKADSVQLVSIGFDDLLEDVLSGVDVVDFAGDGEDRLLRSERRFGHHDLRVRVVRDLLHDLAGHAHGPLLEKNSVNLLIFLISNRILGLSI